MAQTRNIIVLGASYGGLGAAHYIAKHILPHLQEVQDFKYELHLIDPSTHFWWHIAAPRQIVSLEALTVDQTFVPIVDGFKQYDDLRGAIIFHHGHATALDKDSRTVTIALHEGGSEYLDYYALVIATGIRSPTALTTLQGDYTTSVKALKDLNTRLSTAKEVVISGGGPVGVETAGEIATAMKGRGNIALYSGSDKLLPVFNDNRAAKAQKALEGAGVNVVHNVKVMGTKQTADGRTQVSLENGQTVTCDVYIPGHGVTPNTEFLPEALKTIKGYVKTNSSTLRVDTAGPRIYAAGDVAGVDHGGVLNMFNSIPVLGANIAHDLLTDVGASSPSTKVYTFKPSETQLVPIGPRTGIGAFNGWGLPGFMVAWIKGKDYMVGQMGDFTEGKKFIKA